MSLLTKKIGNVTQRPDKKFQSPSRRISCKDLGKGDCEGWLWNKKINIFKNKFVRRWCVLKNNCFYYYIHTDSEKAEGIIHVEDFKVSPIEKFKSNNFYFKIYNEEISFTFGSDTLNDFTKWVNKLQLSASNVVVNECDGVIGGFNQPYIRSGSSTLRSNDTIPNNSERNDRFISRYSESEDSDVASDVLGEKTSEEIMDNQVINEATPDIARISKSLTSAEHASNSNRSTEELNILTISAITRIVEIERLIRNKKLILLKIDEFLKLPTTSENIRDFWENNSDEINVDAPFMTARNDL